MSGAANWLRQQKKGELLELADSVGFTEYDGMKKTDLELALDDYLTKNSTELSSDTRLQPFYKRRSESSPIKRETSTVMGDGETTVKRVRRRATKVAEEIANVIASATDDETEAELAASRSRTALTRTPARSNALTNISFPANVPLPPSPAVVADAIDRRTAVIRSKLNEVYTESGITETAQATRETLSTVTAIQAILVAYEVYHLRPELLTSRYAFTIPANAWLHTSEHAVKIPDMFLLLTSSFWGPFLLWLSTSVLLPLFASYFFNLTSKPKTRSNNTRYEYTFDPLTFNIVKALLTFVIYGQDVTFGGLVNLESVARINSALYGGWQSILVGSGIGILVTMYEAVLKK
ncbi:hypothetical protein BP6252_04667 [Coleophoma cylindrospora]|uniref:Uncharacterized protein n=1 Tax=Coleophoma cylindrospora TaxID=1849047 RepID=A0A3D8S156_9HELO|nr:hypothetical protein BP6252_04667 [Coleophoma cylindrospora]